MQRPGFYTHQSGTWKKMLHLIGKRRCPKVRNSRQCFPRLGINAGVSRWTWVESGMTDWPEDLGLPGPLAPWTSPKAVGVLPRTPRRRPEGVITSS